jgi:DNA-binding transcriptional LysR family regulator
VRNARGVGLTEQGEVLLSYARRILALYKEAEQRLGRDSAGPVRIGAPDYFDFHILSSLLAQFSAHYPAVRQQIELGIGPDISALLDEGELDIAIVASEIGESDGLSLRRERRVWAGARAMQRDPKQPAPLALILPTVNGGSSPWSSSIGRGGNGRSCCKARARRASSPRCLLR